MEIHTLQERLSHLNLPEIRYYNRLGSTNDLADEWARQNAPDLALVVADEQTAGRGRMGRTWFTPAGAALAFSLVLRPGRIASQHIAHLTALGALAVCITLKEHYHLPAEIKWPNDVLLSGKKCCGVLVEANWQEQNLRYAILGVGINVSAEAIPQGIPLNFPATAVETALGQPVDRLELLAHILERLLFWRTRLGSVEFLEAWKLHLAFLNQEVRIIRPNAVPLVGVIDGLAPDGALILRLKDNSVRTVEFGEVQVRPG